MERLDGLHHDVFVSEVVRAVHAHGGEYDGWGGLVRLRSTDAVPDGIPARPAVFAIRLGDGSSYAGLTRNALRRAQAVAIAQRMIGVVEVRLLENGDLPRAERRAQLQGTMNAIAAGEFWD